MSPGLHWGIVCPFVLPENVYQLVVIWIHFLCNFLEVLSFLIESGILWERVTLASFVFNPSVSDAFPGWLKQKLSLWTHPRLECQIVSSVLPIKFVKNYSEEKAVIVSLLKSTVHDNISLCSGSTFST